MAKNYNQLNKNTSTPIYDNIQGINAPKKKNVNYTTPQENKQKEEQPTEPLPQHTNKVIIKTIHPKQQILTCLTGNFPVPSNRGKKYLFVIYNFERNSILTSPINVQT